MQRLKQENPEAVFEAVNAIQSTAWRIRKPVLSLLKRMQAERNNLGLPLSSMPPQKDVEIGEDLPGYQKKALKQKNQEIGNLRAMVALNIQTAEEFADFEEIFIPHHLDSRGRVYPLPAINPQGADYIKGLLEFAEGKRIGEEGIQWLKIHTANLFGVDKVPFEDRIAWVNANLSELVASADDPFECRFWTKADKPIQAYAACLELRGVLFHGPDFVSRMAIALDGSCSGLQHLGAAFRCSVTAKAVNLLPGEKPNDIYQDVADKVQAALEAETDDGAKVLAGEWLRFTGGKITRKITKRSVMTFPYGSKAPGFTQQLIDDILKPALQADPEGFPFGNMRLAAQYLAGKIERAVSATVLKAAEAMEWMQAAAATVAAAGTPIQWTTPLGFPVVQDYRVAKSRQIDSVIFGKRLQTRIEEETDQIDSRKMQNAISPNVVHSLDSSHLLLTVLRAREEGIDAFALIHDSFGTHPSETPRFFQIIREAFVEMYEGPVFENLETEFRAQVDEKAAKAKKKSIPELPTSGAFDLSLVEDSPFAFA
jgi:DNA-directed RNA polymerase